MPFQRFKSNFTLKMIILFSECLWNTRKYNIVTRIGMFTSHWLTDRVNTPRVEHTMSLFIAILVR
jgi:hypothetical protein